ncbi:MAG TPA: four helix bundle protein [Candidatus Peribacteraceae bacterium]|nr:four helix bundle protein [Candidatus Peribacteraceae bacterium]
MRFIDMNVWHRGLDLVEEVYRLTKKFPKEELYAMTSQLRRASASIVANFAEGYSRSSSADKCHKYAIARGECSEVEALLLVSVRLKFPTESEISQAARYVQEVGKMLTSLIHRYQ